MKAMFKALIAAVSVTSLVTSSAALAVTKPKTGFHCVNSRNQEIKAVTKMSECKAPYHWLKAPSLATKVKVKANRTLAHAKKHKNRVSAAAKKSFNQ